VTPPAPALITAADLALEADAEARERAAAPQPPPVRLVPEQDRASRMEAEAASLLRLASATRELALARSVVAELGIAQWCTRCDTIMPPTRESNLCSFCTGRATKTRWMREHRATSRSASSPTSTTTQEP